MSSRTQSIPFAEGKDWRGSNGRKGGLRKGQKRRSLSPGQVMAILRKLKEGMAVKTLGREYLVNPNSIYLILLGRTYKDVKREEKNAA